MNQRIYLEMESEISFWKRHANSLTQEIDIHKARVKKLEAALEKSAYLADRLYLTTTSEVAKIDSDEIRLFARKALEET